MRNATVVVLQGIEIERDAFEQRMGVVVAYLADRGSLAELLGSGASVLRVVK